MTDAVPVIGITTYRQAASWGDWTGVDADLLPADYARAVEAAGGVPVLLPPVSTPGHARAATERLDGLILAGGADIDPARYGASAHESVVRWYADRDAAELAYLAAADAQSLPVLGICRGMQLLAVARGGTLRQHLPDDLGHTDHSGTGSEYGLISVEIDRSGRIGGLLADRVTVPCHHHQGVDAHPGFVATARSADGALHAMEQPGERFVVGVQWHPEVGIDDGLFRGLVTAARANTPSAESGGSFIPKEDASSEPAG